MVLCIASTQTPTRLAVLTRAEVRFYEMPTAWIDIANIGAEACDEDFYCAADDNSATWCCPNELGLEDCASKFNLPALSTPTPSPTSTSTKPTSTAVKLTSGVETASTTAEATLSTTTGPDQPIVTESTGKSSLVHVETSSTLSSSGSDIPCVTSVVESTDMRATSTMTRADSAPDATCTVYTTALALAPAPTVSSVTTSGSDANSATISPGSPDPLSNNVMISAASGHSGVVRGTTMLLGAVAITGALLF